MSGLALIFFILFALVLVGMYLSIRRTWLRPGGAALAGGAASIVLMALFSLAQGNTWLQAVVVGLAVGGVFTALTVSVANFFQRGEEREAQLAGEDNAPEE